MTIVTAIIPTLNEAGSIAGVLQALPRVVVSHVIVADGGSSDATREIAAAHGAQVLDTGRGYGRACLLAAEAAAPGSILIFMDGDGADDPQAIAALVAPIRDGECDFIVASRARGEREPGSMHWHQLAAGIGAGWMIRLLYGVHYTDMCALRALKRSTLLNLGMQEMSYGWNIEMQMRAARRGLRIREIPVRYRRRTAGDSKVAGSLPGTLRAATRIVATFFRVAMQTARAPTTFFALLGLLLSVTPARCDEAEPTPEQRMEWRHPQPVRTGDLIGLAVSDETEETIGTVRRVVRTDAGKIQLVVSYGGLFGWAERLVAVPIEFVAALGRHIFSVDMQRDQFATAPTWYGSGTSDIDPNETIRIAIQRR